MIKALDESPQPQDACVLPKGCQHVVQSQDSKTRMYYQNVAIPTPAHQRGGASHKTMSDISEAMPNTVSN